MINSEVKSYAAPVFLGGNILKHFVVFFIVYTTVFCNVSSSDTDGTDAETYLNHGIEKHNNASQLHAKLDNTRLTDSDYATELKEQIQSQYKEAIADFDKAIELNPNYAKAYYYRGLATYKNKAIELNSNYAKAHYYDYYYRGTTQRIDESKYEYSVERFAWERAAAKILPYFDKAIELSPTYAEAYYMRGLLKDKFTPLREGVEEVIKDFGKAILWKPDFADAYFHRGRIRVKFGHSRDQRHKRIAIVDFEKAIQLKTSFTTSAYANMGAIKIRLGLYRSAIKDYDKAIELNPDPESYLWRARAKFELEQHEAAMVDYDNAVQISFKMMNISNGWNYRRCLLTRIHAYFEIDQYPFVIEDCNKLLQFHSNPPFNLEAYSLLKLSAYSLRGNARVRLHQYEEAMEDYEKYLQIALNWDENFGIEGQNARDFYKLGLVKWKLGLYNQAHADFKEAWQRSKDTFLEPKLNGLLDNFLNLKDGANSFSYETPYGGPYKVNLDEELKEYTTVKF